MVILRVYSNQNNSMLVVRKVIAQPGNDRQLFEGASVCLTHVPKKFLNITEVEQDLMVVRSW